MIRNERIAFMAKVLDSFSFEPFMFFSLLKKFHETNKMVDSIVYRPAVHSILKRTYNQHIYLMTMNVGIEQDRFGCVCRQWKRDNHLYTCPYTFIHSCDFALFGVCVSFLIFFFSLSIYVSAFLFLFLSTFPTFVYHSYMFTFESNTF